ncbi:glycosyltransferase 25 family member-like isoform X3 [Tigriopus californicus]|uniref:glycosyltransferase 25 family member-like isoform X3 n=1 Tax=Tigriopus californicus TaxID=6832 RepID=UPI0027D9D638|nr:glycosyltransferase 25 family member-like isoform X3 [Tigriopus californicus]
MRTCHQNLHPADTSVTSVRAVMLARNKAHVLPFSLELLQDLDYPKNRMALFIRSDHNQDETVDVLHTWLDSVQDQYYAVNFTSLSGTPTFPGSLGPNHWTDDRFSHLIQLKQEGMKYARSIWSDFVWFLDADVLLTHNQMLRELIPMGETQVISAPMLKTLTRYSNFWAGMSDTYYYARTDEYDPILGRTSLGCHSVPMVHTSVLVNLNKVESLKLTFLPEDIPNYDGPRDDIIVFALSAQFNGVPMYICNNHNYGYTMVPLADEDVLEKDFEMLSDLRLQIIADIGPLEPHPDLAGYVLQPPLKNRLDVDHIYMINLKRRSDRKAKMEACFQLLGIDYEYFEAVDGRDLNEDYLEDHGIRMLDEFQDPLHGRPLTYGEIGCFMSHYHIWKDIIKHGYQRTIVFEDDIRFEPNFRESFQNLLLELSGLDLKWDLIYLGRKILHNVEEPWLEHSNLLVTNGYTYWTLAYMITLKGAQKLVDEQPLGKMVPVDEYLPIMFDKHPNNTWSHHFKIRDLRAFSVHPRFVHPTHYTGEEGYFSDTEATSTIAAKADQKQEL